MRHGSNQRRSRGGRNAGRRGNSKTQVFDSNGPDVRIRGTAFQVFDKYTALAKDALASGDAILAESYLQHAEHYQRVINELNGDANNQSEENSSQQKSRRPMKTRTPEDDLALPASILTPTSESKEQMSEMA